MNDDSHQDAGQRQVRILKFQNGESIAVDDVVATEEPLEIRIVFGPKTDRKSKSIAVTMRTPGHDEELARGFLLSEGILQSPNQVGRTEHVGPPPPDGVHGNTLMVELAEDVTFAPQHLQRNFYTTSSCGVCGKASLEAIYAQGAQRVEAQFQIAASAVNRLPDALLGQQAVFQSTGGLHAAGLFHPDGKLVALREDVGRHNALDKLIGSQMLSLGEHFPGNETVLVVSGRASFELVQKAIMGRIPIMIAVGAPSSLAVELANEFNVTLIGFASKKRFNVYSGQQRISK